MELLMEYMAHFGIRPGAPPRELLRRVIAAYTALPYENITKITKGARRGPDEVIRDHIAWGTGGTCFSLTSTLRHLVRGLGWEVQYILADRRYGPDTHCALLVWIEQVAHLVDPGYLIINPIPLFAGGEREIDTGFNRLILVAEPNSKLHLFTNWGGARAYRLTYKTAPVDEQEFAKAWDASFDWEMMRYPLLTRISGSVQIYLRGSHLRVTRAGTVQKREELGGDLVARIASEFHIHPSVVSRAILTWEERGENFGKASAR
jgi:arylamine N-acetyltransferase